jgi:hypothetical protein
MMRLKRDAHTGVGDEKRARFILGYEMRHLDPISYMHAQTPPHPANFSHIHFLELM